MPKLARGHARRRPPGNGPRAMVIVLLRGVAVSAGLLVTGCGSAVQPRSRLGAGRSTGRTASDVRAGGAREAMLPDGLASLRTLEAPKRQSADERDLRNFDPIGRDNIKMSGFFVMQVGMCMSTTGDLRSVEPGSFTFPRKRGGLAFVHSYPDLIESITSNQEDSAYCL